MAHNRSLGGIMHILWIASSYVFLWLPLVVLLLFSFNTEPFPSSWKQGTFRWYRELIHSPDLWKAFMNSLIIALASTFSSLTMTVCLLFFVAQGGRIGKSLSMFYGSVIIPEAVLGVSLLGFFSLISVSLGFTTLIVGHTVLGLGLMIPLVYSRYLELDSRLTEASLVLGATPVQTFFKVTLPLLRPSLITSALLIFVVSFDDFVVTYFCAGSSTQTLSLYILSMIRAGVSPVVNALSAVLLCMSSLMALLYFRLSARGPRLL